MNQPIRRLSQIEQVLAIGVLMLGAAIASAADSPREKLLMDFGWKFYLGDAPDAGNQFDYPEVGNLAKTRVADIGKEGANDSVAADLGSDVSFVQPKFDDSGWRKLDLPHDWAVELPFDKTSNEQHGFKPVGPGYETNSIGWYRREFELPSSDKGRTLWLEFDGVYRDSLVWLNGHCLGRHVSGYTGFCYDISRFANYGGKNELVVRADASRFEGWFYEGAGIYRHVWLEKTSPVAIAPDGIFVWSQFTNYFPAGVAGIVVQTKILNMESNECAPDVYQDLFDPKGNLICRIDPKPDETVDPNLKLKLDPHSHIDDETGFILGIPTGHTATSVAADLNFYFARHGMMPCTNAPILWSPETPALYKLVTTVEVDGQIVDRKETEFGIRTIAFDATNGFLLNGKHYEIQGTCNHQDHAGVGTAMPDALQDFRVEQLKEMGCNAIRTSHNEPTPELLDACDRLGMLVMDENRRMDSNDFSLGELKNLVLRDRNHPSVFIWSLGNEEGNLQGKDVGAQIAAAMQDVVHKLDPTRLCTAAMNGGWGFGFSTVLDVQGFNYGTRNIKAFRAKFPDKPAIGTETASTRVTRGIYTDDKTNGYVAAYGTNGIEQAWQWWPYYATHPFTSGGFVWTGFDYRGEPTPYRWPCISSHFGLMDTCGFPKDIYYYYQSWWTGKPVLHIMPHWNWPDRIGQNIPVRVFSNCKEVELFLNGKSLGRQTMRANWFLDWDVAYEPGVLSAKGYDGNKLVTESKVETTGAPAAIRLTPDRSTINADGEDLSIVTVSVVDAKGRVVPVADNEISFTISGGKIIGVGNGDPSSHEADKASQRKVFCGLAQVIVQSTKESGKIRLTATSPDLRKAEVVIKAKACTPRPFVP